MNLSCLTENSIKLLIAGSYTFENFNVLFEGEGFSLPDKKIIGSIFDRGYQKSTYIFGLLEESNIKFWQIQPQSCLQYPIFFNLEKKVQTLNTFSGEYLLPNRNLEDNLKLKSQIPELFEIVYLNKRKAYEKLSKINVEKLVLCFNEIKVKRADNEKGNETSLALTYNSN